MTQDERTPRFPHRHAARFGWPLPPLKGGSDQADEQAPAAGEGTPSPEEQLGLAPPALPFSIEDTPETLSRADAIVWLRAREAQMNAGVTKVVNEAIDRRKEAETALSLQERLENEESRRQAIEDLLAPYDIELEWPDAEVEGAEPVVDDTLLDTDPELVERLGRVEEYVETQAETRAESEWIEHVTSGLEAFARREKITPLEGLSLAESIPRPVRDTILNHAMQLPRTESGQLDIAAAVGEYDQTAEHIAKAARAGYIGSKDTPTITLGGATADPHQDLSTQEARLRAANLIAQRHVA